MNALNPIYEMMGITGAESKKLDDEGIRLTQGLDQHPPRGSS